MVSNDNPLFMDRNQAFSTRVCMAFSKYVLDALEHGVPVEKAHEEALENVVLQAERHWDQSEDLMNAVNRTITDNLADPSALLAELERITRMYAEED